MNKRATCPAKPKVLPDVLHGTWGEDGGAMNDLCDEASGWYPVYFGASRAKSDEQWNKLGRLM
jgi:hypothetical protein